MKNNINKMYRFGDLANTIYLIVFSIMIPLGIFFWAFGSIHDPQYPKMIEAGKDCLRWGIYMFIACILAISFTIDSRKKIASGSKSLAPHIVTIVFGAVSHNPFYVLAGIFGLIVQAKENKNQDEPKQLEEAKELEEPEPFEEEPKAE